MDMRADKFVHMLNRKNVDDILKGGGYWYGIFTKYDIIMWTEFL
jgi:hypothetical protein